MLGFAPLGALPLGGFPGGIGSTVSKAWRRLLAEITDTQLNIPPPRRLVRVYDPDDEKILEHLLLNSFF